MNRSARHVADITLLSYESEATGSAQSAVTAHKIYSYSTQNTEQYRSSKKHGSENTLQFRYFYTMKTSSQKNTQPAFAYFITIRTYGTRLPGNPHGSVDRKHNIHDTPFKKPNATLHHKMQSAMREVEFLLNDAMRTTVLQSILETARCCQWQLLAAHIRSNHLHVVVRSHLTKEKTMEKIKCYATKDLKKQHLQLSKRKRFWVRHASTRNVWAPEDLFTVMYYVIARQGEPMALYYDKQYYNSRDAEVYALYVDG